MSEATDLIRYVQLLQFHDWAFEFSDDHSVWKMGDKDRKELERLQKQVDADLALWNEYAPADFRRAQP